MKLRYNLESYNFEKFITKYFSNDNEEMKELEESYFEERKREEEDKDELVLDEDCCNSEWVIHHQTKVILMITPRNLQKHLKRYKKSTLKRMK